MKHRKLNHDQLDLLHGVYRFRFATRSLLADYLRKPNNTSLYSRIRILEKYQYLHRRYEPSYRLAGREAEFSVTYKGAQLLREHELIEGPDTLLQATYRDKTVSSEYVQQLTLIFAIRNLLSNLYDLQWFTGRDVATLEYFPAKKPTAFLSLKVGEQVIRCFVEYVPRGTSSAKIRSRLKQYSTYFQQDAWGVTELPFPKILYIPEDGLTEQGVRYHIKRELYHTDTDIEYYTTTQKALLAIQDGHTAIWTGSVSDDELLALDSLPT